MKSLFSTLLGLLLLMAFAPTTAVAQDDDMSNMTIAEIAQQNDQLRTLVAAASAVGMADDLSGEGPLTVFAPTDAAFQNLPEGLLQALTRADNRDALVNILQYHIAGAELPASAIQQGISDASDGMLSASTMNGELTAMQEDGEVKVRDAQGNTATVTTADIMASNGVIHIIDAVLLPENVDVNALLGNDAMDNMDDDGNMPDDGMNDRDMQDDMQDIDNDDMRDADMDRADNMRTQGMNLRDRADIDRPDMDLVQVAQNNGSFSTLVAAVEAADLKNVLRSDGDFTVFAPSDDAFNKIPADTRNSLMQSSNQAKLKDILTYHVISGELTAKELTSAIEKKNGYLRLQTLGGGTLMATMEDGQVMLTDGDGNKATITQTDVAASNGIIHVIDTVVMPGTTKSSSDMEDDMR